MVKKNKYKTIDKFDNQDLIGIMNYAYYLLIKSNKSIDLKSIDVVSFNCKKLKNTF